ncbi:hypothetical protein ACFWA6_06710 [Streptomyces sp. NPDC060020]|uniref:hypothetical protein n=1 Tax=Streptomyces sp. NPDC060020 TaxID=3347038 RepID=UPI003694B854
MQQEWLGEFLGCRISVVNSMAVGLEMLGSIPLPKFRTHAKLYLDGVCVDTNTALLTSRRSPLLRGRVEQDGHNHVVEAFLFDKGLGVGCRVLVDGLEISLSKR